MYFCSKVDSTFPIKPNQIQNVNIFCYFVLKQVGLLRVDIHYFIVYSSRMLKIEHSPLLPSSPRPYLYDGSMIYMANGRAYLYLRPYPTVCNMCQRQDPDLTVLLAHWHTLPYFSDSCSPIRKKKQRHRHDISNDIESCNACMPHPFLNRICRLKHLNEN